jgi:hypothetical protein
MLSVQTGVMQMRAVPQQYLDHFHMPTFSGHMQRCQSDTVLLIQIRVVLRQYLNQFVPNSLLDAILFLQSRRVH